MRCEGDQQGEGTNAACLWLRSAYGAPLRSKDVASSEDVATQKVRLSSADARNPASPTISLAPLIASNKPNAVACCKWGSPDCPAPMST